MTYCTCCVRQIIHSEITSSKGLCNVLVSERLYTMIYVSCRLYMVVLGGTAAGNSAVTLGNMTCVILND